MRWDESHESRDVIDRRAEGPTGGGGGSFGGGGRNLVSLALFLLTKPHGWVLVVLGVAFYFGRALFFGDGAAPTHGVQTAPAGKGAPGETVEVHFVSFVLDDVQSTWDELLVQQTRQPYHHAKLVLYRDATSTACGAGEAATGPFYCPADEYVYLDLGFFDELSGQLGARGQFAQAYVVAHEIGHHVQKILGIHGDDTTRGATGASVRFELQADCFAGIWARSTQERNLIDASDVASAMGAAAAVGDDRLQRMATGTVSPEKWTHGSAAERAQWFRTGMREGTIAACNTFAAKTL